MRRRSRVVLSWSSGKDAAFALWVLRREAEHDVDGLLTTTTAGFGRVAMHGVRVELLRAQARAANLTLREVEIPYPCPNAEYERRTARAVDELARAGVTHLAFGDLYLEEIRAYRERRLAGTGITPIFPLWGRDTRRLAEEMISAGIEAYLVCVDPKRIDRSLAGRRFDRALLDDLPESVDPCGENGEFHTFVANGPMFSHRIEVDAGAVVERDGFVFADLVPARARSAPYGGPARAPDRPGSSDEATGLDGETDT